MGEAERRYRAILAVASQHPDALHYLGVLIARALLLAPGYVDARNKLGNVQKQLGLAAEAQQSYRCVRAALSRPG